MADQRVVVVTGASSGIGAATARACARAGMHVVLAARREALLKDVANDCAEVGASVLPVVTDLRCADAAERLVERAIARFSRVDVFVANAGIGFHTPLAEATDEQLREIVEVNVLGVMRCARAVAPHMISRGSGHFLTVSSVSFALTWPNDSVYGATKAAIHRFAIGLSSELAPHGISVTDVVPGVIDTPLTRMLIDADKTDPRVVANAVVEAIRFPRREVVTPGSYRWLLRLNRLFPSAVAKWMARGTRA